MQPFLKWPGGKRWLAPTIGELIGKNQTGTYFEPFLGGGAIFFYLHPQKAVLADVNEDLISTYREVARCPYEILRAVKELPISELDYYRIRESEPQDGVSRAARFLYLNRTAFGGIYRLNRFGKFNVPYGKERTPEALWRDGLIEGAAPVLASAELQTSDFEPIIDRSEDGDMVYCDPTYTVAHNNNGFLRYNERNFAWKDQERLAEAARRAARRGVTVFVSNAFHDSVRDLYRNEECHVVERLSQVSRNPDRRGNVCECLFVLRPR